MYINFGLCRYSGYIPGIISGDTYGVSWDCLMRKIKVSYLDNTRITIETTVAVTSIAFQEFLLLFLRSFGCRLLPKLVRSLSWRCGKVACRSLALDLYCITLELFDRAIVSAREIRKWGSERSFLKTLHSRHLSSNECGSRQNTSRNQRHGAGPKKAASLRCAGSSAAVGRVRPKPPFHRSPVAQTPLLPTAPRRAVRPGPASASVLC